MKVRLNEITESPVRFNFRIERRDLQKLEERFGFEYMDCEAELHRSHEFIELNGSYRTVLNIPCDLCLDKVSLDMNSDFRLDLVSEGNLPLPAGDVEITMDSPELDFYSGEELILDHYFEDQLILDLPYSFTCKENCKGLCSSCGVNLNYDTCKCRETEGSNPFAILKDLKPDTDS